MDITYQIKFFNDWHCGSGLAAGADVDLLVIKDKNNLPFVPGRTIKGLLREAATDITHFREEDEKQIDKLFGKRSSTESDELQNGCLFFSNATLDKKIASVIIENNLSEQLYRSISSTAIDTDGIAKDKSLRRMQVTVPCELYGEIKSVPKENLPLIEEALQYIKRLGQNRNRGLGRCDITVTEKKGGEQ